MKQAPAIIPFFKGIKLIRSSSCGHPLMTSICSQTFFQVYCIFTEQELLQGDIIVTNYNTSLVLGLHILEEVCYLTRSVTAISFSMVVSLWSHAYVKYKVFIYLQKLWKMDSINLAYVIPKLAKVWHIGFIESVLKESKP